MFRKIKNQLIELFGSDSVRIAYGGQRIANRVHYERSNGGSYQAAANLVGQVALLVREYFDYAVKDAQIAKDAILEEYKTFKMGSPEHIFYGGLLYMFGHPAVTEIPRGFSDQARVFMSDLQTRSLKMDIEIEAKVAIGGVCGALLPLITDKTITDIRADFLRSSAKSDEYQARAIEWLDRFIAKFDPDMIAKEVVGATPFPEAGHSAEEKDAMFN